MPGEATGSTGRVAQGTTQEQQRGGQGLHVYREYQLAFRICIGICFPVICVDFFSIKIFLNIYLTLRRSCFRESKAE